jgi:hypothetical protein
LRDVANRSRDVANGLRDVARHAGNSQKRTGRLFYKYSFKINKL